MTSVEAILDVDKAGAGSVRFTRTTPILLCGGLADHGRFTRAAPCFALVISALSCNTQMGWLCLLAEESVEPNTELRTSRVPGGPDDNRPCHAANCLSGTRLTRRYSGRERCTECKHRSGRPREYDVRCIRKKYTMRICRHCA
ncbi:hypothetical protein V8C42DRAFT_304454 [Trichoderma barbatum]